MRSSREPSPFTPRAGALPAVLVGRRYELDRIQSSLQFGVENYESQCVALVGGSGLGKSSLLNYISQRPEVLAVSITGNPLINPVNNFALEIQKSLVGLRTQLERGGRVRAAARRVRIRPNLPWVDIRIASKEAGAGSALTDALANFVTLAKETNKTPLLLIDELQELSKEIVEVLLWRLSSCSVRLLVAGLSSSIDHLLFSGPPTGIERKSNIIELERLDGRASMWVMLKTAALGGVEWDPDIIRPAVTACKGIPFNLQKIGDALWRAGDLNESVVADVLVAYRASQKADTLRLLSRADLDTIRLVQWCTEIDRPVSVLDLRSVLPDRERFSKAVRDAERLGLLRINRAQRVRSLLDASVLDALRQVPVTERQVELGRAADETN